MKSAIEKLIEISSGSLISHAEPHETDAEIPREFERFLGLCNGGYAFQSALHIFPRSSNELHVGLDEWNDPKGWVGEYDGMANDLFFFAEDLFGCQFALRDKDVFTFEPETGDLEKIADGLESWARLVLNDFEVLTGASLAAEWQSKNGPLEFGKRLLPKVPFIGGGEFEVENLFVCDALEGMRLRAEIARKIRDAPDGASLHLVLRD